MMSFQNKRKGIIEEENFYGHLKRLNWIQNQTTIGETILEVGCGTGAFITTPLILSGRDAYGVDIGERSIQEANRIARLNGVKEQRFLCKDIAEVEGQYDVVICSEVLEHISDEEQDNFVSQLCNHVRLGGKLIITVPNGKGSYEIGQKYFKKPVECFIRLMRPFFWIEKKIKSYLLDILKNNKDIDGSENDKSSLNGMHLSFTDTPHVQWFSFDDICGMFVHRGFFLLNFSGASMFADVITNTFFLPNKLMCQLNNKLGDLFPEMASGYYFCFRKTSEKNEV